MTAATIDVHRLGDGATGTALALVEHAGPGPGGWGEAHRAVSAVAAAPVNASASYAGLFRGAPALGYLLHRAGRPAYRSALAELDRAIDAATRTRLTGARDRIGRGEAGTIGEYDLISGLTGLGLYQMVRHPERGLLPDVLSYLVALTTPLRLGGRTLPGWWCGGGPRGIPSDDFPGGHANLGMAHGIAGPLALLSAAMSAGIEVSGHHEAIEGICAFLDAWRQHDQAATWWPETLTWAEYDRRAPNSARPGRPSWCYGVPGLARAQQLAGHALRDPSREHIATRALAETAYDERQLGQITDAGLCHGWAGLLHAARRVAADVPDLAAWNPALRTLRRRTEDHLARFGPPHHDGLLDGRAGLGLVEHAGTPDRPLAEDWDACLLLTFPTRPDNTATRTPTT